jgi:hypothetical protein
MPLKFPTFILSVLLSLGTVFAASFESANQQFKAGDLAGAVTSYEKIISDTGPNAATYYNLGNAYQSLKQYGPAILAYERARLISPRDPDLLANLALARKAAGSYEETGRPPWLDRMLAYFSRQEISWIVISSAVIFGLLFLLNGIVRLPRRLLISITIPSAIILLTSSSLLHLRRGESRDGIILADQVNILLSPFENAQSIGSTSPGRRVIMGQKQGGFHYVEIPGGSLRGWVSSRDVSPVIPGSAP